ncbi:transmembrane GTPase fzo1 [Pseudohyphozyma bogoriensis]|nr:transmembrane GTPase fzo1 [Pseudohyphozyma bogoriensis]
MQASAPSTPVRDRDVDSDGGMMSPVKETTFTTPVFERRSTSLFGEMRDEDLDRHHEEAQTFGPNRETLSAALTETSELVKDLQKLNEEKWMMHYPHDFASNHPRSRSPSKTRAPLVRSATSIAPTASDAPAPTPRPTPMRSSTSLSTSQPLSILSIDLSTRTNVSTLPSLLPSLALGSISHLVSRQLTTSLSHLSDLKTRVLDNSSRVLVTGDLNSGKSTFVNALLRREVMPSDQQPCTSVFCEVVDLSQNEGKEEIHAIKDLEKYDAKDESTYDRFEVTEIAHVQEMARSVDDGGEGVPYVLLKAFVKDGRKEVEDADASTSFIKNGLVSISLIDAPGLNRDTLSTTALFARQSEIDVIVFVVSAENHFTLSGKEFLWNASSDKAFVFVVVNKWDGIRDKKRCERTVGEQIKNLSPGTWANKEELVHFVDAAHVGEGEEGEDEEHDSWIRLEQSLRSFVLLKRSTSKLAPAQTYLMKLLSDLLVLSEWNVAVAQGEKKDAEASLEKIQPVNDRLRSVRDKVDEDINDVEEKTTDDVKSKSWARLERAIEFVSRGVVPPAHEGESREDVELPAYPGLVGLWDWANSIKSTLVKSLELEIRAAEEEARTIATAGVAVVTDDLSDKFVPKAQEGEETIPARVFRPEAMFARRRRGAGRLAMKGVAGGLGLGTVAAVGLHGGEDFEVSFLDLFDLERVYSAVGLGEKSGKKKTLEEEEAIESGVALVSLGLGSVGMIGSRMVGVKGTLDSIVRVFEMLGSKEAREWAAPVIAVGLGVYLVYDLPRALPRNIGRKLEISLTSTPVSSTQTQTFATAHSERISRETRKVVRLAGWDLRERYRAALDKSEKERKEVEESIRKADGAIAWLEAFERKVKGQSEKVEAVELGVL